MKQEERELLLRDLSARLPYDVRCKIVNTEIGDIIPAGHLNGRDIDKFRIFSYIEIYPYLRPMSSMTEEEIKEHRNTMSVVNESFYVESLETFDFYNKHHIDYRNMIGKGLALEAPSNMYKFE